MCDLHTEYGIDLDDFFRRNGRLPLKKLLAFIRELPPHCRLYKHLLGEKSRLDQKEHLLLDIIEILRRLEWQTYYVVASNGLNPRKMKKPPKRIVRPGDPAPKILSGRQLVGIGMKVGGK